MNGFYLQNKDLRIPKGCVMALVERNGAGKTTLMNTIFENYKITRGNVFFHELNIKHDCEQILHETAFIADYPPYPLAMKVYKVKKL